MSEQETSGSGGTVGGWQICSDVNARFVSFEFERETGTIPFVVFVNETNNQILVGFDGGWSTTLEAFLPGFQNAIETLRADIAKGFSGIEP